MKGRAFFWKRGDVKMQPKRLGASILGAVLAGASIAAPVVTAYDLGDYPKPFITDSKADFIIVVGARADPIDVVGAIDIAARLGAEPGGEPKEITISGGTTVTGGEEEEIALGDSITSEIEQTLDDSDLAGLKDTTLTFDGAESGSEDYDYHEEVILDTSGIVVATSLTSNEEDYGSNVYLEVQSRGAIRYCFEFDDEINLSAEVDSDHPLELEILGQKVKITSVTASSITAEVGETVSLNTGDSTEIEGKTVKLVRTSDDSAVVEVDGKTEVIDEGQTKTVNGLKIKVEDAFGSTQTETGFAVLVVGTEVSKTYKNGDAYIGEDEDNPNWVWELSGLNTNDPTICVKNDFVKDDYDDNPVTVGESYVLPNDYVKITLDSLTVKDDEYATYTITYKEGVDLSDVSGLGTSEKVFEIKTSDEEGLSNIYNTTGVETDTVYLYFNGTAVYVLYKDTEDNEVMLGGTVENNTEITVAKINYQDTKLNINLTTPTSFGTSGTMNLTVKSTLSSDDLTIALGYSGGAFSSLGDEADTEEAEEVRWASTNIGTKDKDMRTKYGIIVKDPESNGANDKVELLVPADQVKAKVVVSGPGTQVTTTTETTETYYEKVVPIDTDIAYLDTDSAVSAAKAKMNLILVGGPAVNSLVRDLFRDKFNVSTADDGWIYGPQLAEAGYCGSGTYIADSPESGQQGLIKLVNDAFTEGKVALIVMGCDVEGRWTKAAARVLQLYDKEEYKDKLAGKTEVRVTGSLENPTIS